MTDRELAEAIVKFIVKKSERESIFLTPHPAFYVSSEYVMDEIVRLTGISPEQIDQWCQEAAKTAEADE